MAGGRHGEAWQHYDRLILDMYKKMGGPSLHLRQIARMHETVKLYRQAEHCLREFRLKRSVVHQAAGARRPGLGRDRGDSRCAVPLD